VCVRKWVVKVSNLDKMCECVWESGELKIKMCEKVGDQNKNVWESREPKGSYRIKISKTMGN